MTLLITAADRYFSLCVRERSGWKCDRCGKQYQPPTTALHCAHWHSRGSWSVRFDASNALAMCFGCHQLTSRERDEHRAVMRRYVSEIELDRLAFDKNRPARGIRKRVPEIAKWYRAVHEDMQRLRAAGITGRILFEGWTP